MQHFLCTKLFVSEDEIILVREKEWRRGWRGKALVKKETVCGVKELGVAHLDGKFVVPHYRHRHFQIAIPNRNFPHSSRTEINLNLLIGRREQKKGKKKKGEKKVRLFSSPMRARLFLGGRRANESKGSPLVGAVGTIGWHCWVANRSRVAFDIWV